MKSRVPLTRFIALGWIFSWISFSAVCWFRGFLHPEATDLLSHLERSLALRFDAFGRELLTLTASSSIVSILVSTLAVSLSCGIALLVGGLISLSEGKLSQLVERLIEGLLAFPSLLLALSWAAIRGPGWSTLLFALLIGNIPSLTRFVTVRARELAQEEYVLAARSYGASSSRILRKHLSPALVRLLWLKIPSLLSHALIAEASLTFLGVGAPIGTDTWGSLLAQGKDYLIEAPHISLEAGLPLVLSVLALQRLSTPQHPIKR